MSALTRIVGLACLAGALYTGHRSVEFWRHGEVVPGTVVAVDVETSVGPGGVDRSERPEIRYTPQGERAPRIFQADWSNSLFGRHHPGDTIDVRYLPEDPADARIDSRTRDVLVPVLLLVIGILGVRGHLQPGGDDDHWFVWRDRRE